jgi:hypothetical protein
LGALGICGGNLTVIALEKGGGGTFFILDRIWPFNAFKMSSLVFGTCGLNLGAGGIYPGGLIFIADENGGGGTNTVTLASFGGFIVIALLNGGIGATFCFYLFQPGGGGTCCGFDAVIALLNGGGGTIFVMI